ncbi:Coat F domain protein [Desulfofarcimen acetoxidans DSM 771]|jgi:spore coat protein CotF|uniref:Coat F domain protein n=1 Tax=Desulfofarcimen acetoxidans (strain ATCC 49208 / DSM 771 / KCTC 5769 / VKM B-1644 / 5575) TaxID=485916 RepID=C8W5E3_DESAS|nr:spore coat protein [Desulfofarcimen acetoxidans]ACV62125.1 Coat F domain protein [Desulfofarcimen acetoxidans DSM 771]
MKKGIHEAMEMHEVLNDEACTIEHYSMYTSQCQDHELRNILERQQRHMIEDYHRKLSVMQGHGLDVSAASRLNMEHMGAGQNTHSYPSTNTGTKHLNDKTIAAGALLFHKCGATRSTNAALECSEPHLRNLLAGSARSCMEMAYEIFQFMSHKGWYQLPEIPQRFINHMPSQQQYAQHQYTQQQ